MAGPAGATLQATKRGKRYWSLRSNVQQAITLILGRTEEHAEGKEQLTEAPGLLEVQTPTLS